MKNKLYHFGDSYATVNNHQNNKHFVHLIADTLNFDYISFGLSGLSNEIILNKLLEQINNFNNGDIIFINFSFFVRGCYYDRTDDKIKSTNILYNELYDNKIYNKKVFKREIIKVKREIIKEGVIDLMEYYLKNTIDYSARVFELINTLLTQLYYKGVLIFYIYIEETDYSDNLIKVGTNISFENGFGKWLLKNKFHNEEDVHYTFGIQPMLSDVIIRKTDNLNKSLFKKVSITIDDLNFSKMQKKLKLL